MRVAGVRPHLAGKEGHLRLPGDMVLFAHPGEGGTAAMALREAFFCHWRNVALLDQYDARRTLKPGMVVLDLGANTGAFTILASRLVGADGLVVAVEPCRDNFGCLEKTAEASGLTNVRALRTAVGDRGGELRLSMSPSSGKHSAILSRGKTYEVAPLVTTDSVVGELGLERVDFIKVDVEGMEPEVLRGAAETIRRFRPRLAVSAYHLPEHATVLPQVLSEIAPGYRVEVRALATGLELEMFAVPEEAGDE
jgi:FkbM family methyltransferase